MEPNLPKPHPSPESAPILPSSNAERITPSPEVPKKSEQRESSPENNNGAGVGDTPPPGITPTITLPPVVQSTPPIPSVKDDSDDNNPLVANDEGLIEKEWVDKAKKVVASTKDDPYAQEKEVSKLQADYLQKRYGKKVKIPGER